MFIALAFSKRLRVPLAGVGLYTRPGIAQLYEKALFMQLKYWYYVCFTFLILCDGCSFRSQEARTASYRTMRHDIGKFSTKLNSICFRSRCLSFSYGILICMFRSRVSRIFDTWMAFIDVSTCWIIASCLFDTSTVLYNASLLKRNSRVRSVHLIAFCRQAWLMF
jgi:hypothetical protein